MRDSEDVGGFFDPSVAEIDGENTPKDEVEEREDSKSSVKGTEGEIDAVDGQTAPETAAVDDQTVHDTDKKENDQPVQDTKEDSNTQSPRSDTGALELCGHVCLCKEVKISLETPF